MTKALWHIIAGEYPPFGLGVADYTAILARELVRCGNEVHVWTKGFEPRPAIESDVFVHRCMGNFGPRSWLKLNQTLDQFQAPRELLVQYVVQSFGYKGLNLGIGVWSLFRRWFARDRMSVMFHEVATPFQLWPLSLFILAIATRINAACMGLASHTVFLSTPKWRYILRWLCSPAKMEWLPIPSNVVESFQELGNSPPLWKGSVLDWQRPTVGHFGTYGSISVPLLEKTLSVLLRQSKEVRVCLMGQGSQEFLSQLKCKLQCEEVERVTATGRLDAMDLCQSMLKCNVLLQPHPHGLSARHASSLTALALSIPLVTTKGEMTEAGLWEGATRAVEPDPRELAAAAFSLAQHRTEAEMIGQRGKALYDSKFALRHTINRLQAAFNT